MNILVISGFIGTMEELRPVGETNVLKFTVATPRSYKKQDGTRDTDWHTCEVWGKQAEIISQYFAVGRGISIQGELQYDKWTDNDGNNRTSAKVKVSSFSFPPIKKGEEAQATAPAPAKQASKKQASKKQAKTQEDLHDVDELPF